ncbi:MAG: hypothetical protein J0M12_06460, partial [Deltaproteobacteria bacterium]|nr:hypothetical protein [Deltaproteobacteria bacterium]
MLKRVIAFLALFSSFSTLVCCAIPALLVSLGLGASLAASLAVFPQLIWLSEHKAFVFIFAGVMLILTFGLRQMGKRRICPSDASLGAVCQTSRDISGVLLYVSVLLYLIGAFFAFAAP